MYVHTGRIKGDRGGGSTEFLFLKKNIFIGASPLTSNSNRVSITTFDYNRTVFTYAGRQIFFTPLNLVIFSNSSTACVNTPIYICCIHTYTTYIYREKGVYLRLTFLISYHGDKL